MIPIKKRSYTDLMNIFVPIYYFFGTLISITYYNIFHPISLSSLGIFLVYYFMKFLNDFRINKFVLIFIIFHIFTGVFYWNIFDFFTMTLYSVVVFSFSLATKFDKDIYKKFSASIVLMNFINTLVILVSPASRTRYKTFGNITIKINYFEDVSFSIAALTALLAIILVFKFNKNGIKSNILKLVTVLSALYNIFTLGKVSVLLGLVVAVFITKLFFLKRRGVIVTKIVSNLIIIGTFFSGWILSFLIEHTSKWDLNYSLFTGRRNLIWDVYLDYFLKEPINNKLFGSFFIRTYNDIVQQGFAHPHNQWITIMISTGLLGLIIYFILLNKAYNYTIKNEDKVGFAYLVALNIYATTDDYILLSAGCLNAFLLFYFASKNKME